ncbi:MAG: hypothetical protein JO352_33555 [Chloroflexi bacterium]|nr:hypothetical protein [Chloroflexota bacterium]MBV9601714.1 hypothetical protein [Chloroflexota bacterium]
MTAETTYGSDKVPPNEYELLLMSGPLEERARELGKAKGTIWNWRRKITETRRHDDSCVLLCTNYDEQQDNWFTLSDMINIGDSHGRNFGCRQGHAAGAEKATSATRSTPIAIAVGKMSQWTTDTIFVAF